MANQYRVLLVPSGEQETKTMIEQHHILNAEQVAMLRRAITPAPAMSEERPMLCETPQADEEKRNEERLTEAYLKTLTQAVERWEEYGQLIWTRVFEPAKERLKAERRFRLLLPELFRKSDDYYARGVDQKELEQSRSEVMELGADNPELSNEVEELLRRLDAVAKEIRDFNGDDDDDLDGDE